MSSPMFPNFPGSSQEEVFLENAITNPQQQQFLEGMNFTVIQMASEIPQLVDDLCKGPSDLQHPVHFLDLLWDRSLPQPQSSGIIIYRTASVPELEGIIQTRGWFIDTLQLPDHFLGIRGTTGTTSRISLADVLVNMRFLCYEAKQLCSGFRACHNLSPFAKLLDLQAISIGLCMPHLRETMQVDQDDSFLEVLTIMAGRGLPISWDQGMLQTAENAVIRDFAAQATQRPLSDDIVCRYVHAIKFQVDVYQWYRSRLEDGQLAQDSLDIALERSKENCQAGYDAAEVYGVGDMPLQGEEIEFVYI